MQLSKTFLWAMIASLGLAALLAIVALLLPRSGPEEEILSSVSIFACFSIVALMCAVVLERRRVVVPMWIGLGSATLALFVWIFFVWFHRYINWDTQETVLRIGGTLTVGGVFAAQGGLLTLPRFDSRRVDDVRRATIGVSTLLAVYIVVLIWWFNELSWFVGDDILARVLGVLSVLAACGTVVTPILWKVQSVRRTGSAGAMPLDVNVKVVCPRCHTDQSLNTGEQSCGTCGLRIRIDVEEPRCVCGYLLHKLEADRCPECGRAIAERDRWAGE